MTVGSDLSSQVACAAFHRCRSPTRFDPVCVTETQVWTLCSGFDPDVSVPLFVPSEGSLCWLQGSRQGGLPAGRACGSGVSTVMCLSATSQWLLLFLPSHAGRGWCPRLGWSPKEGAGQDRPDCPHSPSCIALSEQRFSTFSLLPIFH